MHELEYAIWEITRDKLAGYRNDAQKERLAQEFVERELPASYRQAKYLVVAFAVLGVMLWILAAL